MKKYIFLILLSLSSCINQSGKNTRYTKDQIKSLHLDSTKILTVQTDSVIKINLNPFLKKNNFKIDTLIKEISLIPIETTNESLLDAILKVIVTDSNIYIHDTYKDGGLVIFDRKGKFIKRIPNGRGPGELTRLYDIAFDQENNKLIAYQHSFLLHFTPSGDFIKQERIPFGFYNFEITSTGYLLKTLDRQGNEHLGTLQDFSLLVTDKNFTLKSAGMHSSPDIVNYSGYHYLYKNSINNIFYVTQRFNDTIFQYNEKSNQLRASYILDYREKALPLKHIRRPFNEFENFAKQNDYYFYIGKYCDTNTHHVFYLSNWNIGLETIVYRDKTTGNMIGGTNADFSQEEIPPMAFPRTQSGDNFISWYYPGKNDLFATRSTMISEQDKKRVQNLTENDNPVLVFFKLKEF